MALEIGKPAPEFTLTSNSGEGISLGGLRGKNVLLAFFVHAFTGG